jgi:alpha-tubulin suppressor-like RCC1 family protein
VTAAGVAYCWGRNDEGQVGDGTTAHRSTPAPVAAPAGVEFVVIDAGVWSTCAVARSGAAYCWGVNDDGQLGDGTTTGRTSPTLVAAPVGIAFATIDVGLRHTCALSVTGAAYCWGSNGQGRVGDGSVVDRYIPVPVER